MELLYLQVKGIVYLRYRNPFISGGEIPYYSWYLLNIKTNYNKNLKRFETAYLFTYLGSGSRTIPEGDIEIGFTLSQESPIYASLEKYLKDRIKKEQEQSI